MIAQKIYKLPALMLLLTLFACQSTVNESGVLATAQVQEVIAKVEKNYIARIDRKSLEQICLGKLNSNDDVNTKIDQCIYSMINSLDKESVYFSPEDMSALNGNKKKPTLSNITANVQAKKLFGDEIGYIKIIQLLMQTKEEILSASYTNFSLYTKGLVIDLRDNQGGLLGAVKNIAELFLPENKPIISIESQYVAENQQLKSAKSLKDTSDDTLVSLQYIPIVILVNENTASGAEALSAALAENDRALVIGRQTAKRGGVQTFIVLKSGGALKLTSYQMVTPSGDYISEVGVKPDISIDMNEIQEPVANLEEDPWIKLAYQEILKSLSK